MLEGLEVELCSNFTSPGPIPSLRVKGIASSIFISVENQDQCEPDCPPDAVLLSNVSLSAVVAAASTHHSVSKSTGMKSSSSKAAGGNAAAATARLRAAGAAGGSNASSTDQLQSQQQNAAIHLATRKEAQALATAQLNKRLRAGVWEVSMLLLFGNNYSMLGFYSAVVVLVDFFACANVDLCDYKTVFL